MDQADLASVSDAHEAVLIDQVHVVEVGPGCTRRDLPGQPGVRIWIVDMQPGSQWPHVDHHDRGEAYYVLAGEVIEGEARYRAGTYVSFALDSSHQPRTETGVRLIGINPVAETAGVRAP